MKSFKNKSVLVTGALGGIGKALCQDFAKMNSRLLLVVRKKDEVFHQELIRLGASEVRWMIADLGNEESLNELCDSVKSETVDICFNNAGVLTGGLLENQPQKLIGSAVDVNVKALILLTQALLPLMIRRKSGLIVNTASVTGVMNFPSASTYAATKAAVIAFTRSLESELRGTGVKTLLLITPGVKTNMFDKISDFYGEHLSLKLNSVTTEQYSKDIINAIRKNKKVLMPTGAPRAFLWLAQHHPNIFSWLSQFYFTRQPLAKPHTLDKT